MVAKTYKLVLVIALLFALLIPNGAKASYIIIQDAEIEEVIKSYTSPLFKAAGLNPEDLTIFLVQSDEINAFATSGNRIFVFTGLILNSKKYTELTGVLAHETAHIAGGHLVRLYDNMSLMGRNSLISTILGGIAAVATGRADVGMAIAMGGSSISQKSFLKYRRSEEHIADEIAVEILNKTNGSIQGLYDMMKTISTKERFRNAPDSYLSSHPVSNDRLLFLENAIKNHGPGKVDTKTQNEFVVIQTKLAAFLMDPDKSLEIFTKNTYADRYGRIIALFRKHEIKKAIEELDQLIAENPTVPYLYELKGQILFENGRVKDSIEPYQKAHKLDKHPLIRLSLAQAEIEVGDEKILEKTLNDLKKIVAVDGENARAFRYMAICAGKLKNFPYADYYMAEYNFILKNYNESFKQASRAEASIPTGSITWQRIQDIIDLSKSQIKKGNK